MADPIPMVLHCPRCGFQHVDKPEPDKGWDNPPHRSHLCGKCQYVWRPADVATVGVEAVQTRGSRDHELVTTSVEDRVCALVQVEEGDTEINHCYFEVLFLGRLIWDRGGTRREVPKAARQYAKAFQESLRKQIRGT